jgi:hypothetical protein
VQGSGQSSRSSAGSKAWKIFGRGENREGSGFNQKNTMGEHITKQLALAMILFTVFAIPVVPALGGALQQVPPGGDVFIGEEGLNLTGVPSGTMKSTEYFSLLTCAGDSS